MFPFSPHCHSTLDVETISIENEKQICQQLSIQVSSSDRWHKPTKWNLDEKDDGKRVGNLNLHHTWYRKEKVDKEATKMFYRCLISTNLHHFHLYLNSNRLFLCRVECSSSWVQWASPTCRTRLRRDKMNLAGNIMRRIFSFSI